MRLRRHAEVNLVKEVDRVTFTVNLLTQSVSSKEAAVCPWCRQVHARADLIEGGVFQCRHPDCKLWFHVFRYKSGRVATVCVHDDPREAC
jgi:hypothetical protein